MALSTSYSDAMSQLRHERLVAPVYFILAGSQPYQGAVLTRDRNNLADKWVLDPDASTTNSWYLLETNYVSSVCVMSALLAHVLFPLMFQDHWKPVDPYDNRRYYGNHYMQYLGQKVVSMDEVYHVLSTWPVCNKYTTYTTLMSPANFTLTGYDVYE